MLIQPTTAYRIAASICAITVLIIFITPSNAYDHRGMRGGGMHGGGKHGGGMHGGGMRGGGMRGGGGFDARSGFSIDSARAIGLEETGLKVKFPENISCEGIASEFGSPYRYDGSKRPRFRMAGLHGGLDLSLDIGTPLLAVANGVLVKKGEGGRATGNFIFVKFNPVSTGFKKYIYAKYQHLDELPQAPIGTKFTAGQQIAISGDTGTSGGYFGSGYPHLHLTMFASEHGHVTGRFGKFLMKNGRMIDPLAIYLNPKDFSKIIKKTTTLSGTKVEPSLALKKSTALKKKPYRYWPVYCADKAKQAAEDNVEDDDYEKNNY